VVVVAPCRKKRGSLTKSLSNSKPEHTGIKSDGPLKVCYLEMDVANPSQGGYRNTTLLLHRRNGIAYLPKPAM
jgi:hypothetical protein